MKKTILLLFLISPFSLFAQTDKLELDGKELTITPVYHGSLIIKYGITVIYIDPHGDENTYDGMPNPNIICITHPHGDHANKKVLSSLDLSEAQFVWPQSVYEQIGDMAQSSHYVLANDESIEIDGVEILAVPMYNLPNDENARHKKGWGNGYVITIGDKRFYISGDTQGIDEMRNLKNIDFAFVCMNLPYTMDVEEAVSAILDFAPKVVYPYHFRGAGGVKSDVEAFKDAIETANPAIEVRLRNWYPN